jgi:predicted ester cyclase
MEQGRNCTPATGKRVAVDGVILDRVVAGKMQERWEQFDQSLMLQQPGFAWSSSRRIVL